MNTVLSGLDKMVLEVGSEYIVLHEQQYLHNCLKEGQRVILVDGDSEFVRVTDGKHYYYNTIGDFYLNFDKVQHDKAS